MLLGSIPVLALFLWHILACLGDYMDNIKGLKHFYQKLKTKFDPGRLEEEEMKRLDKVLRSSQTLEL